jgi:hypothetical protein
MGNNANEDKVQNKLCYDVTGENALRT